MAVCAFVTSSRLSAPLRPLRTSLRAGTGLQHLKAVAHPHTLRSWRQGSVIPLASYSGGGGGKDDKSWSEIAEEATSLVKNVAGKVATGVSGLVGKLLPRGAGDSAGSGSSRDAGKVRVVDPEKEARDELYRRGSDVGRELFGGGLVGRAMGGLMGSALRSVGETMAEASRQVAEVQARAAAAIEGDPRVRSALGGSCQAGAAVSQSSMTQIINGRSSKRVSLILPVQGAGGRMAQAQVEYVEGGEDKVEDLTVAVQLPDGSVVRVGGGSARGSAAGQTIDVDWREV